MPNLTQLTRRLQFLTAILCGVMFFLEVGQTQFPEACQIHTKSEIYRPSDYVLNQIQNYLITTNTMILPDIQLIDSEYVNAFAIAPNVVILSSGLIKILGSRSELAFVIGHEMGHLLAQESYASLIEDSSLRSLDQELSADLFAIKLMEELGYNPHDSIVLLEKLAPLSTGLHLMELRVEHLVKNLQ